MNARTAGRPSPDAARIFISYRRRETAGHAGRLYDGLSEHFGADRVFMDVTMEPGVDFADTINEAVGDCGALVALIGEDWLTVADAGGRRRIDDPADIHRMEIEAALDRQVRLIPALVQDAEMPAPEDLPEALRPLVRRQAVELSDARWDYDVSRLIKVLERVLHEGGRARRTTARLRRLAYRYRGRVGFAAGVLSTLVVVGAALAATGYFEAPLLRITSFEYEPPAPGESIARRCVVRAESDYRVTKARFIVDGNDANSLHEQTSPPWQCDNTGENRWNTCLGHSRGFPLDPDRPHTLTATLTDSQGNTTSSTRTVDTNCPGR
jgi:TIR domain-containing protein